MNSPEFDAALAKTEYDNAVKSLMAASVLAAKYQGERDAAVATIERVKALHVTNPAGRWCRQCGSNWPCMTIRTAMEPTP